jgi:transcriptional regulator
MYTPRHFAIDDRSTMLAVMRENSFATLVTPTTGGLQVTHIPLLVELEDDRVLLTGHFARANPHWKAFSEANPPVESLAIFSGPHGYISPSYYQPGPAVPTWDYVAVHAYGTPIVVEDASERLRILERMVQFYEDGVNATWSLATQDPGFVARMAEGTVAFHMPTVRIEGKAKLGQNRKADQPEVVRALSRSESDSDRTLAHLIAKANRLS